MELIQTYFPGLSLKQIYQFEILFNLYSDWNNKLNLISRKDIPFLYERHILHSLAIAKFIKFIPGSIIADVGTGGGFPGVPLAVYFPDVHFVLIDSIAKKIKAVNEIVKCAEINNISTIVSRAETTDMKCDFVVSRAVTGLEKFYQVTKHLVKRKSLHSIKNGIIYLKGGEFEEELNVLGANTLVKNINGYFTEEFFSTKKIVYIPVL